jgi:hypothetical protein
VNFFVIPSSQLQGAFASMSLPPGIRCSERRRIRLPEVDPATEEQSGSAPGIWLRRAHHIVRVGLYEGGTPVLTA